jgi:exonuclease III
MYKMLSWNIRGYKETLDGIKTNKFTEEDFINKISQYDFIFIQETHLDKNNRDDVSIPGFSSIHYCRQRRGKCQKSSGGISIFIKEYLRKKVKFLPENDSDVAWFKVSPTSHETLFIGCVYVPPYNSSFGRDHCDLIWNKLEGQIQHYSNKGNIILCGDFNARTGQLADYITNDFNNQCPLPTCYSSDSLHRRQSMDTVIQKAGRKLANICVENSLYILNGRTIGDLQGNYTCITTHGASVVDYFVCSKALYSDIHSIFVNKLFQYSDHCPIELNVYLPLTSGSKKCKASSATHINTSSQDYSAQKASVSYVWSEHSSELFKAAINSPQIAQSIVSLNKEICTVANPCKNDNNNINARINKLTNIYHQAAELSLTCRKCHTQRHVKKKRSPRKKWFDESCLKQRKEVRSLLNALNRNPFDRSIREKYFLANKKYNHFIRRKKREYKNSIVRVLNEAIEKDPNSMWKLIKELKESETPSNFHQEKLNKSKWLAHLECLLGKEININKNRESMLKEHISRLNNENTKFEQPITISEISSAAKNIKSKKSPGKDGITNDMIKISLPNLMPIIHILFNQILSSGIYPDHWKQGINVPILKTGDPYNPSNYRGITLNNAMANLFCQIINSRINTYLEDNNLLVKEQAGFRKMSRTQDHIFILQKLVDDALKTTNGRLYACFIDFSKAFDNVWHFGLLYKLQRIGIGGKLFDLIQDMYTNATICCRTENGLSNDILIKKGVLQGNTLSPTLFNIFINDITACFEGQNSPCLDELNNIPVSCLMYADDIVILSKSKKGLQEKLNNLDTYCKEWGLQVNREKTKVIVFCKKDPVIPLFFKIGDMVIETTDTYKYLGVLLHKHGNMKLAQDLLSQQASKAIYSFRRAVRTKNIGVATMSKLFDSIVTPILTYGSEIWFPYHRDVITKDRQNFTNNILEKCITNLFPHEMVHNTFCKQLLGVHKKAMNLPTLAELGRFPITITIFGQIISYWVHVINSDPHSLISQTYSTLLSENKFEENRWITVVRELLHSTGFGHVWQNQSTFHANKLRHSLTNVINNLYIKMWSMKKKDSSKLKFYNILSTEYCLQPYLSLDFEHRQYLSRLRISAHDLEIERGRYTNIPRDNRLCKHCNVVEDEFHFLDTCTRYKELRQELLINDKIIHLRNTTPSCLIMNSDCYIQLKIAIYVSKCFLLRK